MPSGLDHAAMGAPTIDEAHRLYDEILEWSHGIQQVIVLGDLNSTRLPHKERWPFGNPHTRPQTMDKLETAGFIDAYRQLYSDPSRCPGYTHVVHNIINI